MDKYLRAIMIKATENADYQRNMDYLMARRAVPQFDMGWLGEGTSGEFAKNSGWGREGNELPPAGKITLNSELGDFSYHNPSQGASTLLHETTHAANDQLGQQYYDIYKSNNRTPEQQQFLDAYRKMRVSERVEGNLGFGKWSEPLLGGLAKIAPKWVADGTGYRSSDTEVPAFGVQNANSTYNGSNKAPDHIDTSVASDFGVLMDLAQRALKSAQPKYQR